MLRKSLTARRSTSCCCVRRVRTISCRRLLAHYSPGWESLPSAGALDFNLGCSGYIYGLGLAKGLIESGQAHNILFLTGETYSKFIHPDDRSVRTIFGDAGSATLLQGVPMESAIEPIGPFVYGTDGRGAKNLIVHAGALRKAALEGEVEKDAFDNIRGPENLYMNGAEIFAFTLRTVPAAVEAVLQKAEIPWMMLISSSFIRQMNSC